MDLSPDQVRTLIQALLVMLDDRLDRGVIDHAEWMRSATWLSVRAAVWLLHAKDGTTGDRVP